MSAFEPVATPVNFPELEERVLDFWQREHIFELGQELRRDAEPFVFYEGPPTANGMPGVHHVLARSFKDCFLRYQQMRGRRVERRGGWDTHGLPVELEIERSLRIGSKQEIERMGVEEFNRLCRASVMEYIDEWERLTNRIGFWLDLKQAYRTYDTEYIESVWWSLKQIYERGWLFRGYRVAPYCPRCQTSLSSHELGQPGAYRDDTPDPGVTVRFRLRDAPATSLLAWTTTPWTLPGNLGLAVGPQIAYVEVSQGSERLILANDCLRILDGPYQVERELTGQELVGLRYQRLFSYLPEQPQAWSVMAADFVATDEGTGIVHTAGAYGEDDLKLCQGAGIEVRHTVGLDGRFLPFVTDFQGIFVKDADPLITEDLKSRGLLYQEQRITHTYPFCWRCETPLLYYALDSWFVRTTAVKEQLIRHNRSVQWVPSHLRDGRMGNWLESLQDWNLSRARYWGTPLPIWICTSCQEQRCVGSLAELGLEPGTDVHKPFIDEVTLRCDCGGEMRRVPEVIDAWYDSGAMPFAQWHYPFENGERFAANHPADFISEGLDQTRGWFYTLLAESVMLFDQPAYRHVVVPSLVVDDQGRKMSKTRGNVVDPFDLISKTGADAVRWWFYTTVSVGLEYRISVQRVADTALRFLNVLWNTQSFLVTYANLAGWQPSAAVPALADRSPLDRWILARLQETVAASVPALDQYDASSACRAIAALVDDTSTWYLRRSRPRFRGSPEEIDASCATLYEVLRQTARLMAPFTPFVADAIFQELTPNSNNAPISVHLEAYPEPQPEPLDHQLLHQMALVRRLAEDARSLREQRGVPIRQPLASAQVQGAELTEELAQVLAEELNVVVVRCSLGSDPGPATVSLDFELTPDLRREGLVRTFTRQLQDLRRKSGLRAGEPVEARYATDDELAAAIEVGKSQIQAQCFAVTLARGEPDSELLPGFSSWSELKVPPHAIWVALRRLQSDSQSHGSGLPQLPQDGP
ncbi:MAG TPA: isoleucine--tRNA ligase [Candidatus Dormibacteraeota bacterium]|nr:isoleucine--tRNA ligase [Candidatus Dormibacteraeota bacterium]